MGKLIDLSGKTFGKLSVIKRSGSQSGHAVWLCKCSCGNEKLIVGSSLVRGATKSCGCMRRGGHKMHGHARVKEYTPEYRAWLNMHQRCENPNHPRYHDYGNRGIKVCSRWTNSFEAFLRDMGTRPSPRHSIERVDNNKGYSPDNCTWATKTMQARNRRIQKNNTTGHKGVSRFRGRYRSEISVNKKNIHIGVFDTLEDAVRARIQAEHRYWHTHAAN